MDSAFSLIVAPESRNDALASEAAYCGLLARLIVQRLLENGADKKPRTFSYKLLAFMLGLACALRLREWQSQGYLICGDGLQPADEAVRLAMRAFLDPAIKLEAMCAAVLRLEEERFAWSAPRIFGAGIAVDDLMAEDALDAIAEFLWATRNQN